jgi:hypothetical protein
MISFCNSNYPIHAGTAYNMSGVRSLAFIDRKIVLPILMLAKKCSSNTATF